MRILFLGTPDFSVPCLRALAEAGYEIVGVVTQPDRQKNRGHKVQMSPVKQAAIDLGLPVYQYEKIRRKEAVAELKDLKPDLMITVAYGQILTDRILQIPPLGCINVHASLLPLYRGAAPIQWAVIRGETVTGITTMMTERGVDTGDILLQQQLEIGSQETAGELFDRLAALGAQTLIRTLRSLEQGTLVRTPQNHEIATHYPMLTKENGRIDWSQSAEDICNLVRGVTPWPGAYTCLEDKIIKIGKVVPLEQQSQLAAGTVVSSDIRQGLIVSAGRGCVKIELIQMPGKKMLHAEDFLRGASLLAGKVFDGE